MAESGLTLNNTPAYLYAILPIIITYFGLFIMVNNNYILKPKVEAFLSKMTITSIAFREVLIDLVSSFSLLTLLSGSANLQQNQNIISVLIVNDMFWVGLGLSYLSYIAIKMESHLPSQIFIKNGLILLGVYLCFGYHFVF